MPESPDLNLPAWGPYTKRYIGVSHVADAARGLRFDLSAFPGFYRGRVEVPNVMWESGYRPWEAAPDLAYFSHRHTLQGRDEVYADVAFAAASEDARLLRATLVNTTDAPQALVLHLLASLHFPPLKPYSPEPIRPGTVALPPGAIWINALDWVELAFATPRPTDGLNPDGLRRAEVRDHGFVGGGGIGKGFGAEAGDTAAWRVALDRPLPDASLIVRFRLAGATTLTLALDDRPLDAPLALAGDGGFALGEVALGDLAAGDHTLRLTAAGADAIELDGFALGGAGLAGALTFGEVTWRARPTIVAGPRPGTLLLKYADLDGWYGLAWDFAPAEVREFHGDDLDAVMRHTVHHHTRDQFHGHGAGHFTDVFLRPIVLAAGETRVVDGLVCTGERAAVERRLAAFDPARADAIIAAARGGVTNLAPTAAGEPYRASQERLAATLLTNVVYPVYARRRHIRHNTPGRWWDCLYTWDSGMIGLGLAELDPARATDCLRAYLTPTGDPDTAFLHHGSPVPTQHALFHDLWNRGQSSELLRACYPGLRQYYRFLAGQIGGSTTRALRSGLLKTWDYFYNSGGWDDYPPQVHVHAAGLASSVTPIISTAQAIRVAKILGHAADQLGLTDDRAEYDADSAAFAAALQAHAWDEVSGYFGYVRHDAAGEPVGILREPGGENFNRGFDGLYPLVAGVCTPAQEARLLAHLFSPARHWTAIGLTTVDRSAPYYREDGYWNGAVWFAHQWYFWKTMLDLGRPDLARRIALTALEVWRAEVARSGNCCEHFIVASGRGAGWHHFGGLSAPALAWFGAYFRPGRLTVGLDAWVTALRVAPGDAALDATLRFTGAPHHAPALIATLAPGPHYRARWDGVMLDYVEAFPGVLELVLPPGTLGGTLTVDSRP